MNFNNKKTARNGSVQYVAFYFSQSKNFDTSIFNLSSEFFS